MDKRPGVLFLVNWWYPDRVSALNGIFVKKHAEAVSRFAEVAVLYLGNDPHMKSSRIDCRPDNEDGMLTVRVYYKKSHSIVPLLAQVINQVRYFRAVMKGLKHLHRESRGWDVLHIHLIPPPVFFLIRLLRFRNIPYIITEHSSQYLPINLKGKVKRSKLFIKRIVKRAAAVTVPSGALEKGMRSLGYLNRYVIVPNVVDTELFYPPGPDDAAPGQGKKIKILHISGLKKLKNVAGILRAVKKVRETRDDFEFHVVGDGEEREALEQMAADMGLLNEEVFFHGQKTAAEVAEEMRKADFFVLFSDYENSPCVIVEAMASGLPVIAPDVGGIPEMVNEKTGSLVPPKDEEELLKALILMMDNYDKYDRKYIRAEAVKRFSYQTIGQQFCNIYQGIRKKTGQSRNVTIFGDKRK